MTGLDNVTKADHAPSDMEKQEIVAATARHRERAPRVAVNIRQPEDAAVKISPTHSDGQGWEARLKDALGTTSQAFLEKQEIVAATARHRERAPRVAVNIRQPEDAAVKISPTHSDGQGWEARLKDALGTTSQAFLDTELLRLLNCFCDRAGTVDAGAVNAALAVVDGLKPQNEIEAMLALQMAATHALAMKFSARLYSGALQTIPQQDSAALTLSRLQRTFTTQMDSLSNMRRGGRQKVVVEHVHVYPGGQAIVGNVTHPGRGVSGENSGQPHAADNQRTIAASGSAPMWCPDAAREALPISNREGQEAVSDARGSAGHRSPEGRAKRKLPARLLHSGSDSGTARRKGAAS